MMKRLKQILARLRQWFKTNAVKPLKQNKTKPETGVAAKASSSKCVDKDYFQSANDWAADRHATLVVSRNRYKIAFITSMGLAALLTLAVITLAPLQSVELEIVHENPGGYAWISLVKPHTPIKANWAQTESNIAHYIRLRESYNPQFYAHETALVKSFSTPKVNAQFELSQAASNSMAAINVLKAKGYRSVIIHDVMQLNTNASAQPGQPKQHLAQVNFEVVDHFFGDSRTYKTAYMALVSWRYDGVPQSPQQRLRNWDGFTVTAYQKQPLNQSKS
jgi:type IV secretion system protein VirB8